MRESWIKFDKDKLRDGLQAWVDTAVQGYEGNYFEDGINHLHKTILTTDISISDLKHRFPSIERFVTEDMLYSERSVDRPLTAFDRDLGKDQAKKRVKGYFVGSSSNFWDLEDLDDRQRQIQSWERPPQKHSKEHFKNWELDVLNKDFRTFSKLVDPHGEFKEEISRIKGFVARRDVRPDDLVQVLPSSTGFVSAEWQEMYWEIHRHLASGGDFRKVFSSKELAAFEEIERRFATVQDRIWERATPLSHVSEHPYFKEIGCHHTHGLRVDKEWGVIAPALDQNGKLKDLYCSKENFDLLKCPWTRIPEERGFFYCLHGQPHSNTVILSNSFRDAVTLNELTGHTAIACFDGKTKDGKEFAHRQMAAFGRDISNLTYLQVEKLGSSGSSPEDEWRLTSGRVLGLDQKEASRYGGKVLHPPLTREVYDSKIGWFSFTDARTHWGDERCRGLLKDAGLEPVPERSRTQELFRAVS